MLIHHLTPGFTNTQPGTPLPLIGKPSAHTPSARMYFMNIPITMPIQILGSVFEKVYNDISAQSRSRGAPPGVRLKPTPSTGLVIFELLRF